MRKAVLVVALLGLGLLGAFWLTLEARSSSPASAPGVSENEPEVVPAPELAAAELPATEKTAARTPVEEASGATTTTATTGEPAPI